MNKATKINSNAINQLVWNVIYHDVNGDRITTFNVFCHSGFTNDILKHYEKHTKKEEFAVDLRRSVMYYFWSKCEWEIIIAPWCGGRNTEKIKVDVSWQILNNWELFLDYVWSARPQTNKAKKKQDESCGEGI